MIGALPGQGAGQVRLAGSRGPSQEDAGGLRLQDKGEGVERLDESRSLIPILYRVVHVVKDFD